MNAEWRGLCEGEIVTCFWNSAVAVTGAVVHRLCIPEWNKGAAGTLWIHMLRWILIYIIIQ